MCVYGRAKYFSFNAGLRNFLHFYQDPPSQQLMQILQDLRLDPAILMPSLTFLGVVSAEVSSPLLSCALPHQRISDDTSDDLTTDELLRIRE